MGTSSHPPSQAPSVLIVEDEGLVALELEDRVKALGWSVCGVVDSGERAVQASAERSPDLVLMDIRLKGEMDGIDAAQRILATRSVAVVYITAFADDATLSRMQSAPAYGFVVKPFNGRSLTATLTTAVTRFQRDTAELALSETRARASNAILDTISDAIVLLDAHGRVALWNAPAAALLGVPAHRAVGETLAALHVDLPLGPTSGAPHVARVRAAGGGVTPCVVTAFRGLAEDELTCVVARPVAAGQDLVTSAEIGSGMANHLSSILGVIAGRAQELSQELSGDPLLHATARLIARDAAQGRRVITAGRAALDAPAPGGSCRLDRVLRAALPDALPFAGVRLAFGPLAEALVRLDEVSAARVVQALAASAGEAMPEGGDLTLSVSVEDVDDDAVVPAPGTYAVLRARDTRTAVPADPSPDGPGAGVWMATVVRLARDADGSVDVTIDAAGACTAVYLPLVTAGQPLEVAR